MASCEEPTVRPAARASRHYTAVGNVVRPGDVLDGRFLIVENLCRGGMSTIYKAEDLENDQAVVAVKIPDREIESKPAVFMRFKREEQIGATLKHPSILKFITVSGPKSRPYIVTEFLKGTTIFGHLKAAGRLSEAEALQMASRICEALQYLHGQGVVHRDLKPENIMLCDDGSLRLMDFGVARFEEARRLTFINGVPGTPHYMAPEQVNGQRGDGRTDLYSLGVMLYQMLTGHIPFDAEDLSAVANARVTGDPVAPRKVEPSISPQAEEIILHAMERDLDNRYPNATAFKAELDNPSQVTLTGRCDRLEESTPWKRAVRKIKYVAIWALVPIIAQVVGFLVIWRMLAKH